MKEFIRKKIVGLKRNPSIIPMLMLVVAFLVYTMNLTLVSNSTAKIQGSGMGLSQFATTLFSMLSMVCMLNSYPRRKPTNYPMLIILVVMLGIIVYSDLHYMGRITAAINRTESPIDVVASPYIPAAYNMLCVHIVCVAISAVLAVTLPVYRKWIKKINTSVTVEENTGMHDIELND